MTDSLREYLEQRVDNETSDPSEAAAREDRPMFVVHMHDGTDLRYHFRLEVDAVLKSWALPVGPSLNPEAKRIATPGEDLGLDLATMEGVISESPASGGTMLVWDAGPYRNLRAEQRDGMGMTRSLDDGDIEVWLEGQKLRGGWRLSRTGEGDQWVLVKKHDEAADPDRDILADRSESVLTGRTLEQIRDVQTGGTYGSRGNPGQAGDAGSGLGQGSLGGERPGDRGEEGAEGSTPIGWH